MAKYDPELASHRAWLGLVQPVGLVVSPPALVKAQAVLDRNVVGLQQKLLGVVRQPPQTAFSDEADPYIDDFPHFTEKMLGWALEDLAGGPGGPELSDDLELVLPDYGDTLRPTYAVIDGMADDRLLMLVQEVPVGTRLDKPPAEEGKTGWHASPEARLERLLREKEVAAGLLSNGHELRLVYAPRGETSGHLTFPVPAMCEVAGRPILGAMHMLLSEHRVFSAPDGRRLLDLLAESRKYQAEVSNKLSEQVLGALWDLLAGFQAADEASGRWLVDQTARDDPDHVYGGLLTVLLRLVFLLYAEDQGLMPDDEVYARNYSVAGLYDCLREDAGRYPDTMDQRYGAWAWLLSLFRLVFDGGGHSGFHLPTRHGQLFNPDEYPFLEGRRKGVARVKGERFEALKVSDGCIHRVLEALLVLDGERLSYRALDVEQIGSVYEAMMGFEVERAFSRSIAVKPKHVVFDVDKLLEIEPSKRKRWLKDRAECDLTGKSLTALKAAETAEDIVAALGRKISPRTPRLLPPGALYLQPGEERRRSGSHYTPRELTEPIVRTTLRPVLESLGERPTPEQILDLKVCDPAMGSGAFLVEACRQLAERLVGAWNLHDCMPEIPPDEDPLLHARRLVAQRCLYGVDKNPFAVNLAKLSLWLVTLARDHAFTFLDHALKCGDSLVGLTREQIGAFDWSPPKKLEGPIIELLEEINASVRTASASRKRIQELDEGDYGHKNEAWHEAENALHDARLVGDLVVAAFFRGDKPKARRDLRDTYHSKMALWKDGSVSEAEIQGIVAELRSGERSVTPFHWEVEFPEVFDRAASGFDAITGNPPFLGGTRIWPVLGGTYCDYIRRIHSNSGGKAVDLVAHFFRRAFGLVGHKGAVGFVATNTISQGDTREAGLKQIVLNHGVIYEATKRMKWPGAAAVLVSVVFVAKTSGTGYPILNKKPVAGINSFLFPSTQEFEPAPLRENSDKSHQGSIVLGMGFTFDDADKKEVAGSLAEMRKLIESNPKNAERIFPYIGGRETNTHPAHAHHRYVISFGDMSLSEAEAWPDLIAIIRQRVKPGRDKLGGYAIANRRREYWWQFGTYAPALYRAAQALDRVIVIAGVSRSFAFTFLPTGMIFSRDLVVFPIKQTAFPVLQSRVHEVWAWFFGSTMKDDLRYAPTDCFRTFPFPADVAAESRMPQAGKTYYEFRADLMTRNNEGLTKTYNRFHDPEERDPDILKLRDLHAAMDRAVLDAYGWTDIPTDCEFLLDYEIDEETWSSRKKKPYRYRWPEDVHDEVLARLLDLNQKRYQEEVLAGLHDGKKGKQKTAAKSRRKKAAASAAKPLPLFDQNAETDEETS